MPILFVALGSALGGVGRYLIGGAIQRVSGGTFPYGTLVVNITGAFVLGFIARYALESPDFSPEARLFLTTGICGGYTTFSTFSLESFDLLEHGHYAQAITYMGASLLVSVVATAGGVLLARNVAAA